MPFDFITSFFNDRSKEIAVTDSLKRISGFSFMIKIIISEGPPYLTLLLLQLSSNLLRCPLFRVHRVVIRCVTANERPLKKYFLETALRWPHLSIY